MTIRTLCPACQRTLKVKDALEGRWLPCPVCKHRFLVTPKMDEILQTPAEVIAPQEIPGKTFQQLLEEREKRLSLIVGASIFVPCILIGIVACFVMRSKEPEPITLTDVFTLVLATGLLIGCMLGVLVKFVLWIGLSLYLLLRGKL